MQSFTAMYSRCERGYMGQLLEWPEVVTEGKTIDECRELLQDALQEMIAAHKEMGKTIPCGTALFERIAVVA